MTDTAAAPGHGPQAPRWRAAVRLVGLPAPMSWVRGYQRRWLVPDVLACVTLLAIAVPEQLATSRLAGMPPVTGLYTFIAGSLVFGALGANPLLSVGADSTIAPLFAAGVSHLAPTGSAHYVALVSLVAVTVGVLVALVGLLRMGWIANFLSGPIITGFLGGVAVIIVVHQLPDFLGTASVSGTTVHRVADTLGHIGKANVATVVIGVAVFAVVMAAERVDRKLPGALVGLAGSTVVVAAAHLRAHGVAVLGAVAHHAPHVGIPALSWSALGQVGALSGVVALVVVSQTAATTRAFAPDVDKVDVNRDFVGVGASGIVSGLFGSFATNASPARTAAVESAGGRSQLAGMAAGGVMVLLVFATGLLTDVPVAALAAILLFVATRIFHVRALVEVLRFDLWEFGLAVVTLLTVALAGVEQGIGVAVGLAILDRTRRSAPPPSTFWAGCPAVRAGSRSAIPTIPRRCPAWSSYSSWRRFTTPTPSTCAPEFERRSPPRRTRPHQARRCTHWCWMPTPSATSTTRVSPCCGRFSMSSITPG